MKVDRLVKLICDDYNKSEGEEKKKHAKNIEEVIIGLRQQIGYPKVQELMHIDKEIKKKKEELDSM